jgi:hypothetical protein
LQDTRDIATPAFGSRPHTPLWQEKAPPP